MEEICKKGNMFLSSISLTQAHDHSTDHFSNIFNESFKKFFPEFTSVKRKEFGIGDFRKEMTSINSGKMMLFHTFQVP